MAAGDCKLSMDGAFCYGTAGSTPSTEAENVSAVKLAISQAWAEWFKRGKTFRGAKPAGRTPQLEFNMVKFESETFFAYIRDAWKNKTRIALKPADATGGEGFDADWYVGDWNEDQDDEGAIIVSVVCRYTDEGRDGQYA